MKINEIFNIKDEQAFNEIALRIFRLQYENVSIYHEFASLHISDPKEIKHYSKIPFLPIEFFKTHQVIHKKLKTEKIFLSSGTTGIERSKHYIADLSIYQKSFTQAFSHFYGSPEDYCFLALLPSYLENDASSLIYMSKHLINKSKHRESGFFTNADKALTDTIEFIQSKNIPTLLLGVSYALLDFAKTKPDLNGFIIMETGGMKGRKKEMTREELHKKLCQSFKVDHIHSEYGMTELLSQSYAKENGIFQTPRWKKILIRDINDPKTILPPHKSGGINIIDLANINSCAFIATQDIGISYTNGNFEVLGRFDHSDIRGCNLLSF